MKNINQWDLEFWALSERITLYHWATQPIGSSFLWVMTHMVCWATTGRAQFGIINVHIEMVNNRRFLLSLSRAFLVFSSVSDLRNKVWWIIIRHEWSDRPSWLLYNVPVITRKDIVRVEYHSESYMRRWLSFYRQILHFNPRLCCLLVYFA